MGGGRGIKHCANNAACAWFQEKGSCCNRTAYCWEVCEKGAMTLRCPKVAGGARDSGCGIYVISFQSDRAASATGMKRPPKPGSFRQKAFAGRSAGFVRVPASYCTARSLVTPPPLTEVICLYKNFLSRILKTAGTLLLFPCFPWKTEAEASGRRNG